MTEFGLNSQNGNENRYYLSVNRIIATISQENPMVQRRVLKMLKGENSIHIKDLLESFKGNGYLKIDNVIVRQIEGKNAYLVVEGNRRVATLKVLEGLYEDGLDIGRLNPGIFQKMDVVLYHVDDREYEILMGLRHVSGIKEWGDYEQSELISNSARKHKMSPKDISESLGLTVQMVKKRLNTYYALEIFRNDPDVGEYFVPNKLSSIFYEIMGKVEIRDQWLGWNGELNAFLNKVNMKRLFSWLVPYEKDNGEVLDPIITKRDVQWLTTEERNSNLLYVVGQAKHYDGQCVGTNEIRELAGAVYLLKANDFAKKKSHGSEKVIYSNLVINAFTPIVPFFITSGYFAQYAYILCKNASIIAVDRLSLALNFIFSQMFRGKGQDDIRKEIQKIERIS